MNERYEIDNLKELLAKKKLEVYANKDNITDPNLLKPRVRFIRK